MEPYPVTIRLLDPPLHEFLPEIDNLIIEIHNLKNENAPTKKINEKINVLERVRSMSETNPMLGHRGVRLGITNPDIYTSQIQAIIEATVELNAEGHKVKPQVMVPQVSSKNELNLIQNYSKKSKLTMKINIK